MKKSHKTVNLCPGDKTQAYFQVYEYQQGCQSELNVDCVSDLLSENIE